MREAGLAIDARAAHHIKDVAHSEPLNRHRNILNIYDRQPALSNSTYVAPNATVIGSVYAASNTVISFGATVKADNHAVRIGKNTSIGENCVLECADLIPDEAFPNSLNIGNNVRIEHSCHLFSCIVDDNVHIGFKSVIGEGAQLERGCVIAPNSTVQPGTVIPENTLWEGNPVQFVKELNSTDRATLQLE